MTAPQAPTPGPLDSKSVKLLVKGDLCRRIDDGLIVEWVEQGEGYPCWFKDVATGQVWGGDPEAFAFIGRPDADGWMPWSGGENPVPGQRVERKERSGDLVWCACLSDDLRWSHSGWDTDIIAFRLAPTAPVEASGSEREAVAQALGNQRGHPDPWPTDFYDADAALKALRSIRPQPSGETREAVLSETEVKVLLAMDGDWDSDFGCRHACDIADNAEVASELCKAVLTVLRLRGLVALHKGLLTEEGRAFGSGWQITDEGHAAVKALLSARPLAFGGQHSFPHGLSEEDVDAALACSHPDDPTLGGQQGEASDTAFKIASDLHAAYEQLICGLPKYLEAENLTDEENMIREAYITLDVTAHRLAALSTTPARAEAQDEGAAEESLDDVARRLFAAQYPGRDYDDLKDMVQIGWLRKAHDEILSARAHPSPTPAATGDAILDEDRMPVWPTPAADADRVRIAVEALELAGIRFDEIHEAAEVDDVAYRNEATIHGINANADVARSEVRQALAALKSTAAKEGGEG